ncbi:MAG: DUF302 domain-containing protein [Eikenella sp.]|nr:DUF302 domain-containing protein [Eikenella sp.]
MNRKYFAAVAASMLVLSACAQIQSVPSSDVPADRAAVSHTVGSRYGFDDTVSRLQNAFQIKGMTVFAVIDHQAAARENGLEMQPAKVIVFGTPKAGTPLMVKDPAFALQLPLRVLVTENGGRVEVVYNDTRNLIRGSRIAYGEVENSLANAEKLIRAVVSQ